MLYRVSCCKTYVLVTKSDVGVILQTSTILPAARYNSISTEVHSCREFLSLGIFSYIRDQEQCLVVLWIEKRYLLKTLTVSSLFRNGAAQGIFRIKFASIRIVSAWKIKKILSSNWMSSFSTWIYIQLIQNTYCWASDETRLIYWQSYLH